MAKYQKVLDTIVVPKVFSSNRYPDLSVELIQTESGKRKFEAWQINALKSMDDGELVTDSHEFNPQKTFYFEVEGVSLPGISQPIFVAGLGKRSGLCNKIAVFNK